MGKLTDSIAIRRTPRDIREVLEDLHQHARFNPDGFKYYRYTSRNTCGEGAHAEVLVNLMGFWLPAKLEVLDATQEAVTLRTTTRQARIDMKFGLEGNDSAAFVWLEVDFIRRRLPPWRVRTRIKQALRLKNDVSVLSGRFLLALKAFLEKDLPEDKRRHAGGSSGSGNGLTGSAAPFDRFPLQPNQEYFEV